MKKCLNELHATHGEETKTLRGCIEELRAELEAKDAVLASREAELNASSEDAVAAERAAREADVQNHNALLADAQRKLEKSLAETEGKVAAARAEAVAEGEAKIAALENELSRVTRISQTGPQAELAALKEEKALLLGALNDERVKCGALTARVAQLQTKVPLDRPPPRALHPDRNLSLGRPA